MTREQYINLLQKEVERLNKEIDFKIVHGQGYSPEAKKHRALLTEIRKHRVRTFWNKIFPRFSF
jgi:ribonuclease HII